MQTLRSKYVRNTERISYYGYMDTIKRTLWNPKCFEAFVFVSLLNFGMIFTKQNLKTTFEMTTDVSEESLKTI